jgi:hypothetical protein
MNSTILSTHWRQQVRQFKIYSTHLVLVPEAEACCLTASTISCINWMMARMSDPKARDPKWYLKTILYDLKMGKLV